jgi:hypothetical protein
LRASILAALVAALLAPLSASGRGLRHLAFRVDLATGVATAVPPGPASRSQPPPAPSCPRTLPGVQIQGASLSVDGVAGAPPITAPIGGDARNQLFSAFQHGGVTVAVVQVFRPNAPNDSGRGAVVAVDAANRRVAWTRDAGVNPPHCFVVAPNRMALVDTAKLSLVDPATGRDLWSVRTQGFPDTLRPAAGSLWLLHTETRIYGVDMAAGRVAWSAPGQRIRPPHAVGAWVVVLDAPKSAHASAKIQLRVLDVKTGAARSIALVNYTSSYDMVGMVVQPLGPNEASVQLGFTILD